MDEQAGDTPVLVGVADGHCKEFCHAQHFDLGYLLLQGNGITNHQFFQYTVLDIRVGIATQYRVCT